MRLLLMDFEPLAGKFGQMKNVEFVVHVPKRHALVVQSNEPEDGLSSGMYLCNRIQPRGEHNRSLNRQKYHAHGVASFGRTGEITVK